MLLFVEPRGRYDVVVVDDEGNDMRLIPGMYVDDDASEGCRDDNGVTSNSRYAILLLLLLPSERALKVRLRIIGDMTSVNADALVVVVAVVVVSSIFPGPLSLWLSPSSNVVMDDDTTPGPGPGPDASPCLCANPCINGFIVCNLLFSSLIGNDDDDRTDLPPWVISDNSMVLRSSSPMAISVS